MTFELAMHHDVQQSFQRRASLINRAVFEIDFRDSLVSFGDVFHLVRECVRF